MSIRQLTGSTGGETPIFDGTARGAIATAIWAPINIILRHVALDPGDVADISLVVPIIIFTLGGLWDRFVAPKLEG